jgi:hypothetical protein
MRPEKELEQYASYAESVFQNDASEGKPRTSSQSGSVAVQDGHGPGSKGHRERPQRFQRLGNLLRENGQRRAHNASEADAGTAARQRTKPHGLRHGSNP